MAIPTVGAELISHTRRVCSLYKRAIRMLESYYHIKPHFRYQAVLMRQRFEENKNIKDMRVAKTLIAEGESELHDNQHHQPRKFPKSPGGSAFEREVVPPDWVLDYWHPLEKARYPEYFARREQRKLEFTERWEKQYGKPTKDDLHH